MAFSFAIIVLLGILSYRLFTWMKIPGFLGVLFLGMIIGPYGVDWIDDSLLSISPDLRKIALVVILLRAGLGLSRKELLSVGIPALRLGFLPVLLEGGVVLLMAVYFLKIHAVEAGMLGFILAAVSPAVVVPQMLHFIEMGRGRVKAIPTMILAGSSLDDVVAIIIFSSFAGFFAGKQMVVAFHFLIVPVSIVSGLVLGILIALLLLFSFRYLHFRITQKVLFVLAVAILMTVMEDFLNNWLPIASLLGVMVMGFVLLDRNQTLGHELSVRFSKIWVLAEILLFFLVGAEVDFFLLREVGYIGILIIVTGLLARSLGVYLSLLHTPFSRAEKCFCVIAYTPKATVQAALGAIPLTLGAPSGDVILMLAVLSIVLTAPLGAISTKVVGDRVLSRDKILP